MHLVSLRNFQVAIFCPFVRFVFQICLNDQSRYQSLAGAAVGKTPIA